MLGCCSKCHRIHDIANVMAGLVNGVRAVAGLEPRSASTSTEHFHDTLPKIVVPHLAVSIPESRKKVVAIVPLARTSAPTPAEHSHDVLSTIIVPHVAVSIPKTVKK